MFAFLVFRKTVLTKVIHPLKICQHTKFHSPVLTGTIFASISEVLKSHHHQIQRSIKENNYSNKSYRYIHYLSLYQTSFV
jgi:hypothetical protein